MEWFQRDIRLCNGFRRIFIGINCHAGVRLPAVLQPGAGVGGLGGEVSNIEHEGEVQKRSLGWEPFSFAKRPPLSHVAFFKFFFLEKKENHKTKK